MSTKFWYEYEVRLTSYKVDSCSKQISIQYLSCFRDFRDPVTEFLQADLYDNIEYPR